MSVLCAHYYVLDKERVSEELYEAEKDMYPMLFLYKLEYGWNIFKITTRRSTETEIDYEESFRYLMHYTGDAPAQASFSSYEYYNDRTVIRDEIMAGMFSSQSEAGIKHCSVYQNIFD